MFKNYSFPVILALSSTLLVPRVLAQELSLEEVWKTVSSHSKTKESSDHTVMAAEARSERSARHWFPRLYLDARTFTTNDPGTALFSKLAQREVGQNDFIPNRLNHPNSEWYQRATLGLDLPLYEGGYKNAIHKTNQALFSAEQKNKQANDIQLYSKVLTLYGNLLRLLEEKKNLEPLNEQLANLQKRYRIGSESNPVGYSGSLGMKALMNRIQSQIDMNHSQFLSIKNELNALSNLNLNTKWSPKNQDLQSFINRHLPKEQKISAQVQALESYAKAAESQVGAALSANLPRVGAFAEGYGNRGERTSATGYTAGLYLQWNLFDGTQWDASKEARHHAIAFQAKADAAKLETESKRKSSENQLAALLRTLEKTQDSLELSKEQAIVSQRLFNNGAINALQFVEVISRRIDIIESRSEVQKNTLYTLQEQWMTSTENL